MENYEYISLVCVDPQNNKWRSYAIRVSTNGQSGIHQLVCAWGRMNRYRRSLTTNFTDEGEMMKFLETTLKRRHRHGYQVIDKSVDFPHAPALDVLPTTDNVAGQMRLF